ncbi:MAG: oxygenase MpaB family protein [Thermomicrobiales bacterium]
MSLSNDAQTLTPAHSAFRIPHSAITPVAWKINAETATLLGWGPAILMQLAHPLVAAGVADHSIAVSHPERRVQRLSQTIQAMLAITFGPDDARERAVRAINRIHDRVNGTLPAASGTYAAGTAYSAHDPQLLAWVHATLLEMLPRAYELYVGPSPLPTATATAPKRP